MQNTNTITALQQRRRKNPSSTKIENENFFEKSQSVFDYDQTTDMRNAPI